MRKTLTIVAVVIVVLGVLGGVYFFFFYNAPGLTATGPSNDNPFGGGGTTTSTGGSTSDTGSETGTGNDAGTGPSQVAPKLTEISSKPVGKGFIALDAGSTTTGVDVRYIDRESGNMFDYNTASVSVTRLTNHTVPGVQLVSWSPDGAAAYIEYLSTDASGIEHVNTYRLPSDDSDGASLPTDLDAVIPMSATSVFTLAPNTTGSVGYISASDGSNPVALFSSLFSSLAVKNSAGAMIAYTKPSANPAGYAFQVDRKSGAFTSIVGPLTGLSAVPSPSGALVLLSYIDQGVVRLAFYDTRSHVTTVLPLETLTDKCVWSADSLSAFCASPSTLPSATLPDAWYQGTVSFTDRIWRIDFAARVASLVADLPQLTDTPIDAVSLAVDANESELVFMNKTDGSLWAYSL
jgi:hypothetical protein